MTNDINKVTPYNSEATKKSQVEDMFDNIAPKYDLLNHALSMKIDVLWRNKLVGMMKQDAPQEVLDVATGTWRFGNCCRKRNQCESGRFRFIATNV